MIIKWPQFDIILKNRKAAMIGGHKDAWDVRRLSKEKRAKVDALRDSIIEECKRFKKKKETKSTYLHRLRSLSPENRLDYVIGFLLGDGGVAVSCSGIIYGYYFHWTQKNQPFLDAFAVILTELFPNTTFRVHQQRSCGTPGFYYIRLDRITDCRLLAAAFVPCMPETSPKRKILEVMLKHKTPCRAAYDEAEIYAHRRGRQARAAAGLPW